MAVLEKFFLWTSDQPSDARDSAMMSDKIDQIIAENPEMGDRALTTRLRWIVFENSSVKVKRARVIAIADEQVKSLSTHVACKIGCSHCCKLSTPILEHEAERLQKASGRPMTRLLHRTLEEVALAGLEFVGKPCPFLIDDKCSVYQSRPLICRVHHSLNPDESACAANVSLNPTGVVTMYDADALEIPYLYLNSRVRPDEPFGNIGEFFP